MLLGVSRSLWSLYELGKRDLPPRAMLLLAEMLAYVHAPEAQAISAQASPLQANQQQRLERLLRENQYQQLLHERKKVILEKKQGAQMRYLQLRGFLDGRTSEAGTPQSRCTSKKAIRQAQTDCSTELLDCELKLELLVLEKKLLESKMQKFLPTLENTGMQIKTA